MFWSNTNNKKRGAEDTQPLWVELREVKQKTNKNCAETDLELFKKYQSQQEGFFLTNEQFLESKKGFLAGVRLLEINLQRNGLSESETSSSEIGKPGSGEPIDWVFTLARYFEPALETAFQQGKKFPTKHLPAIFSLFDNVLNIASTSTPSSGSEPFFTSFKRAFSYDGPYTIAGFYLARLYLQGKFELMVPDHKFGFAVGVLGTVLDQHKGKANLPDGASNEAASSSSSSAAKPLEIRSRGQKTELADYAIQILWPYRQQPNVKQGILKFYVKYLNEDVYEKNEIERWLDILETEETTAEKSETKGLWLKIEAIYADLNSPVVVDPPQVTPRNCLKGFSSN